MHVHYCGCDIQLHSVVDISDESDILIADEHATAWEDLYVFSIHSHEDPNRAPTEVAPSTPVSHEGETPSIPDTPHFDPDQGDPSPEEPAIGVATRIEAKERMTQTPPLLSRLIQGYLDQTGIEACPYHQMDHGVRDPDCDHCKRALGPLYHHKIKGNGHLPVFTFDFQAHTHIGCCPVPLGLRLESWAHEISLGVWRGKPSLSRQASVVLPCLQSSFEDLRALTGGSRPPILRMHSDKAREFLSPVIRAYLSQQGVRQTFNSGYDPQGNGLAERWIGIIKVRATALVADIRLPPEYWSYACRWVACVHTHRVTEIPINKTLPFLEMLLFSTRHSRNHHLLKIVV